MSRTLPSLAKTPIRRLDEFWKRVGKVQASWHRSKIHAGRYGRCRFQRDRCSSERYGLADRHAPAGDIGSPGSPPSPLGKWPDGIADLTRSGELATSRRGPWKSPRSGLLGRDGRSRVLDAGQLCLWVYADRGDVAIQQLERSQSGGRKHPRGISPRRLSPPGRDGGSEQSQTALRRAPGRNALPPEPARGQLPSISANWLV